VAKGESKSFLLPYQPPFIIDTDIGAKRIEVSGGLDLLQAS
jgi:16S rRNA processing protein RimM